MAVIQQQFAVRGSEGLFVYEGISEAPKQLCFQQRTNPIGHRLMAFSPCGKFLAFYDGEKTVLLGTSDWQPRLTLSDLSSTTAMYFSPKGTFFCTWHPFKGAVNKPKSTTNGADGPVESTQVNLSASKANLKIFNTATMQLATEFTERNQKHWHPIWTDDEALFARLVGSELLFHKDNDFNKYTTKLVIPKLADFSISPGNPYYVAAYVPPGNQPANVRVYRYPELQTAVANKTFFKADSVSMNWNKKGNAVIIMALTEVDSTGRSYYGESNLYLVLTSGDSFQLSLSKPGPVYHVDWHPNSTEFCVVYGYMPAKATLYNLKGDILFDFGTGPRNEVHYNPRGDIICICGFGNLRGNVEFWSSKSKDQKRNFEKIAHFTAEDTTLFRWAPDGRHFASATTAPRLRVNNGYKLWDISGKILHQHKTPDQQEMWEVAWLPVPVTAFLDEPINFEQGDLAAGMNSGKGASQQKAQAAAYVPPHLRGVANRPVFKLHEEEPASNVKEQQAKQDENLSKQAQRNRKKRELAKQKQGPESSSGHGLSGYGGGSEVAAAANVALDIVNADADLQKKRKNIMKKLEQINVLKNRLEKGETLELNQVEKIHKEAELMQELEALSLE